MRTATSLTALSAIALSGLLVPASSSTAGEASFKVLTMTTATDVTIDEFDRTLVLLEEGSFQPANIWLYEEGGYSYLGDGVARRLTEDGTSFIGSIFDEDGGEAAIWSQSMGWTALGSLPNALSCPSVSDGFDMTADGSTAVGLSWDGCNARAFRWTEAEGMVEMEVLANGHNRASAISDNGAVVVGFAQGMYGRTPAVWSGADDTGMVIREDAEGEFHAVSADGSIAAGRYYDPDLVQSFYLEPATWTASGGIEIVPGVPSNPGGFINDMSADGTTLVGTSGIPVEGRVATVWRDEWGGAVALADKLNELGVSVPENIHLDGCSAISADGTAVVGWCYVFPTAPDEVTEQKGFLVTLPPATSNPLPEDLNGDGTVGFADLTQLLNAWGPCACPEDLNGDSGVGFADLTQLLNAWGSTS